MARLISDKTEAILSAEEGNGFPYVRPVAAALADYEANRSLYPDFRAFAPRIAAALAELSDGKQSTTRRFR